MTKKNVTDKLLSEKKVKSSGIIPDLQFLPTGIIGLDYIMGGGLPIGRIVEIYGDTGTLKSTITLTIVKNLQALGVRCCYVDLEVGLSGQTQKRIGVTNENFHYLTLNDEFKSGRDVLMEVERLITEEAYKVVIIDSLALLKQQVDSLEAQQIGGQARLMSDTQTRLINLFNITDSCLIFINQIRKNISSYIVSNTTPGGNASKFTATTRIKVAVKEKYKDNSGVLLTYTTTKNRVLPDGMSTDLVYLNSSGFSLEQSLKSVLESMGIIVRAGSYYKFEPSFAQKFELKEAIGQGSQSCIDLLRSDRLLYDKLYYYVLNHIRELL